MIVEELTRSGVTGSPTKSLSAVSCYNRVSLSRPWYGISPDLTLWVSTGLPANFSSFLFFFAGGPRSCFPFSSAPLGGSGRFFDAGIGETSPSRNPKALLWTDDFEVPLSSTIVFLMARPRIWDFAVWSTSTFLGVGELPKVNGGGMVFLGMTRSFGVLKVVSRSCQR